MKKKTIITVLVLLLAILAGVVMWPAAPEYGDSYSEQQRKLWNERRALLPWDWMDGNRIVFDPAYLQFMTGLDWKEVDQLRSQKEEQNEQLVSAQNVLRDQLLLVMEAIDSGALSYDDVVTGSAHAAGMGGSQIWLKENEQMTVRDLLKAVCIVSGNDAAVALAEHLAGSEVIF